MKKENLTKTLDYVIDNVLDLSVNQSMTILWGIIPYSKNDGFVLYKTHSLMYVKKIAENRYRFFYSQEDFPEGKEMMYKICKFLKYIPIQRFFRGILGKLVFSKQQAIGMITTIPLFTHLYSGEDFYVKKIDFTPEYLDDELCEMNLPYNINALQNKIIGIQESQKELPYLMEELKKLQELKNKQDNG